MPKYVKNFTLCMKNLQNPNIICNFAVQSRSFLSQTLCW